MILTAQPPSNPPRSSASPAQPDRPTTQSDRQGVIRGIVNLRSGTPMANVIVEIQGVDVGGNRQVTADSSGNYRFDNVAPGRYRIVTINNGVTSLPSEEITVIAGNASVVNLTVGDSVSPSRAVAATSPVTTVTEAAPSQELTGPVIRNAYNTKDIMYLPSPNYLDQTGALFGAYNLTLWSAGVASNGGFGVARAPVVGGQRPLYNNFYVEGIDNNNRANPGQLVYVSNEATAEFVSLQNQFPPEYGHTTGGQFNSIIRTGNNSIHGALYDYFQNRNMNAVDQVFARQGIVENPRYDQNRLGGNLGFPIIADKLFFFGDFEYIPLGFAATPVSPVFAPTAAGFATLGGMRGISQTNLQFLQSALPPAANATSFTTVNGTQIPIGPASILGRSYQNQYNGVGAIDWKLRQSDAVQLRYVHNDERANSNGAALPAFFTPFNLRAMVASLGEYHNFQNGAINELRLGYNRVDENTRIGRLTFPGLNFGGVPNIAIQQDLNLQLGQGLLGPQNAAIGTYDLADNFHWRMGRHTIRAGFDGRRIIGPMNFPQLAAGTFTFSTLQGFLNNLPPDVAGQRFVGNLSQATNQWQSYAYLKDEWRVHPNFDLSLGVRYEYVTIPAFMRAQRFNQLANAPGVLTFHEPDTQKLNFAPQVGIGYAPGLVKNSVFRAGFGMNYDAGAYTALAPIFASGLTTALSTSGLTPTPGFFSNPNGFFSPAFGNVALPAATAQQAQAQTTAFFPDQKVPYTIQWNASWQQQVLQRFVLEVRYLGVRGVHLPTAGFLNQVSAVSATQNLPVFNTQPSQAALNGLTTTLNSLQPINPLASAGFTNPILTSSGGGTSTYHGLQVQATQRFVGGFQFQAAYTWSHLIDDVTPPFFTGLPGFSILEERTTRGTSVFDHRQRGTLTTLWDVSAIGPTGFRWYRDMVANLNLSGTYVYETPATLPLRSGFDTQLLGGFGTGGVLVNPGGTPGTGSGLTPLQNSRGQTVAFLVNNPNAQFINGAPGVFTPHGRVDMGLRPINDFDASLVKRFGAPNRFAVEIRGDAYNILNHPQFTPAQLNNIGLGTRTQTFNFLIPGTAAFLSPESAFASHARMLQVGVRVIF